MWRQPEMSLRHYGFLAECLVDLDGALAARDAGLVVKVGEAVKVLSDLHSAYGIAAIHAHEETGLLWTYARDRVVRSWAKRADVPFLEYRQHGVWRALSNRDGWARRWEQMMRAPAAPPPEHIRWAAIASDPFPDGLALGLRQEACPGRQRGGRAEALFLLAEFLAQRGRPYRRAMSSPLGGAAACSRISAHLAFGCLSMRETYAAAVRAKDRWRKAGDDVFAQSLHAFASRLHWHCHFIQKLEDAPELERRELHPAYANLRTIGPDHEAVVDAWATGRTGFPFVDACMRFLAATGWLNFRMRSMVMAFSSYHLWQDWRLPAQRLARLFTDFEPGIHYPQVQMQSGVTGVNTARIYNPVKQSHEQDPAGEFIRRWVPELASMPDAFLHEPWSAPVELAAERGIFLGQTYPARMIDHVAAAATARERIYAVRKGEPYRQVADAIEEKHGSRRSGLPSTARRRSRPRQNSRAGNKTRQGTFDF